MTYQETLKTISELNHKILTQILTREETKNLIIQRETIWTDYLKNS